MRQRGLAPRSQPYVEVNPALRRLDDNPPPPSLGENPLPATSDVLANGKSLYEANCAVCHGPQGRGDGPGASGLNPPPPDLRGPAVAWSDGQIAAQIQNGRGAMPPFRAVLNDEGIWSVVRYVRALQGR